MSILANLLKKKPALPKYPSDLRSYLDDYDGKPVITIVDLGLKEIAPVSEYPRYLAVIIPLETAGDGGAENPVGGEEMAVLRDVEARCIAAADKHGWFYAGHAVVTAAEHMYMAFYCREKDKDLAAGTLDRICTKSGRHPTKIVSINDPEWSYYLDRLYPDPYQMEAINHLEILQDLKRHGDSCAAARPFSYWLYFRTREAAESCRDEAVGCGFQPVEVKDEREGKPADGGDREMPFSLQLIKTLAPEANALNADAWLLIDLAKKHGGEYDGVETDVVK